MYPKNMVLSEHVDRLVEATKDRNRGAEFTHIYISEVSGIHRRSAYWSQLIEAWKKRIHDIRRISIGNYRNKCYYFPTESEQILGIYDIHIRRAEKQARKASKTVNFGDVGVVSLGEAERKLAALRKIDANNLAKHLKEVRKNKTVLADQSPANP